MSFIEGATRGQVGPNSKAKGKFYLALWVTAFLYFLTARIGLKTTPLELFPITMWIPAGIALAATLIFGVWVWPGILIAAFFADILNGSTFVVSVIISIGNTIAPVLATFILIRNLKFDSRLERVRDVVGFVIVGAILSSAVSATIGISILSHAGLVATGNFTKEWVSWWSGDTMGTLIVTPLILTWRKPDIRFNFSRPGHFIEGTFLVFLVSILSIFTFFCHLESNINDVFLAFFVFPMLIWVAFRFQQKGATLLIFFIAFTALLGSPLFRGIFHHKNIFLSQLDLGEFIALLSITTMFLTSLVTERKRSEVKSMLMQDKLSKIFSSAQPE